jgi:hypothetical protein
VRFFSKSLKVIQKNKISVFISKGINSLLKKNCLTLEKLIFSCPGASVSTKEIRSILKSHEIIIKDADLRLFLRGLGGVKGRDKNRKIKWRNISIKQAATSDFLIYTTICITMYSLVYSLNNNTLPLVIDTVEIMEPLIPTEVTFIDVPSETSLEKNEAPQKYRYSKILIIFIISVILVYSLSFFGGNSGGPSAASVVNLATVIDEPIANLATVIDEPIVNLAAVVDIADPLILSGNIDEITPACFCPLS